MTPALFAFGLYLIATVAVGLWASSRSRGDEEDYFLAGRSLSPVSMALSAVSSGRSAWLVVGASAAAWSLGVSAAWLFPGYIAAEAWMFTSLGPRLRRRSVATGAITVPEVLARAGGTRRLPVQQVAGAILCVFLVTYVSAQLGAGAKTLGGVFAWWTVLWSLGGSERIRWEERVLTRERRLFGLPLPWSPTMNPSNALPPGCARCDRRSPVCWWDRQSWWTACSSVS